MAAFRRTIEDDFFSDRKDPCRNLRHLLTSICLRRASQSHLKLKETHETVDLSLSTVERTLYDKTLDQAKKDIDGVVKSGRKANRFTKLFALILRLRMLCNHGWLSTPSYSMCPTRHGSLSAEGPTLQLINDMGCDICSDQETVDLITDSDVCFSCGRVLKADFTSSTPGTHNPPRKRRKFSPSTSHEESLEAPISTKSLSRSKSLGTTSTIEGESTKLQAVIASLHEHASSSKRLVGPSIACLTRQLTGYSIVFSCWTRTLDLLESLLTRSGLNFARIDGKVSYKERNLRLCAFQDDPNISILLMTMGTGSVG